MAGFDLNRRRRVGIHSNLHKQLVNPFIYRLLADEMSSGGGGGSSNVQKHLSIIIVDDEPQIIKITSRILQSINQTNFTTFDNRKNAIDWLNKQKEAGMTVDILFSDYVMPEIKYFEFRKKTLEIFPNIKIVLMSGTMGDVETDGAEAHVYLAKPFSFNQFISVFEQVTGIKRSNE